MMRARDVMTTEVVTLEEYSTLREAIDVFASTHVSGVPVVAGSTVVGVASLTDVLEFEAASSGTGVEGDGLMEFEDADGFDPGSADGEGSAVYFVEGWMEPEAQADGMSRVRTFAPLQWDRLDEHSVAEVMSRDLVRVGPEATLQEVAARMIEAGVHRVLVMEERTLLGVVSTTDIVRAVAQAGVPAP